MEVTPTRPGRVIRFIVATTLLVTLAASVGVLLYFLLGSLTQQASVRAGDVSALFRRLRNLTAVLWTAYPVVWLLGAAGIGLLDVETSSLVFWGHLGVFALYSALIGYLLFHQEAPGVANLLFYALAMALHFAVTDHGLRRHHGAEFDAVGRWLLAGATVLGGIVGAVVEVGGLPLSMLFGFVAGAIVLNVVKEELPGVDHSRFAAFAAGAAAYTLVLLLI